MSVKVNIPQSQHSGFSTLGLFANTAKGAAGGAAFGPWGMVAGGALGAAGTIAPKNKAVGAANTAFNTANTVNNMGSSNSSFSGSDATANNPFYGSTQQTPDDSYQAIQRRFSQRGF